VSFLLGQRSIMTSLSYRVVMYVRFRRPTESPQWVGLSDPIHVMYGSVMGFLGSANRIIRYFRFDQIQDGGRPPSWKIMCGD